MNTNSTNSLLIGNILEKVKLRNDKPVILTEDIEFSWLDKGLTKTDIESYFVPLGEEHYEAYPIKSFNMTDENAVFERLNTLF